MRAYAEETNRLNRERRSVAVSDRRELAGIENPGAWSDMVPSSADQPFNDPWVEN